MLREIYSMLFQNMPQSCIWGKSGGVEIMLISAMAGEGSNNENIAISLRDVHHAMPPAQTKRNGTFHAFRAFYYLPDLITINPPQTAEVSTLAKRRVCVA
jgi:hypothetical protein